MTKKLSQSERQQDQTSILSKLEQVTSDTEQKVKTKLASDPQVKQTIKQCVAKTLQNYRENLKAARLLID